MIRFVISSVSDVALSTANISTLNPLQNPLGKDLIPSSQMKKNKKTKRAVTGAFPMTPQSHALSQHL